MSKEMTIILLGLWVIIVPYLGIPASWRTLLLLLAGIAIMVIGFMLRAEALARGGKHSSRNLFVENTATVVQDYSDPEHTSGIGSLN